MSESETLANSIAVALSELPTQEANTLRDILSIVAIPKKDLN